MLKFEINKYTETLYSASFGGAFFDINAVKAFLENPEETEETEGFTL